MLLNDRSNIITSVVTDGILEKDLVLNHWDSFTVKRPISYYEIKQKDIQRPDLISAEIYSNQNYWWIILKYNEINDPWNDLEIGDVLKIPNKLDIETWISSIK